MTTSIMMMVMSRHATTPRVCGEHCHCRRVLVAAAAAAVGADRVSLHHPARRDHGSCYSGGGTCLRGVHHRRPVRQRPATRGAAAAAVAAAALCVRLRCIMFSSGAACLSMPHSHVLLLTLPATSCSLLLLVWRHHTHSHFPLHGMAPALRAAADARPAAVCSHCSDAADRAPSRVPRLAASPLTPYRARSPPPSLFARPVTPPAPWPLLIVRLPVCIVPDGGGAAQCMPCDACALPLASRANAPTRRARARSRLLASPLF